MKVYLGDTPVFLTGKRPKEGDRLDRNLELTPAFNTKSKRVHLKDQNELLFISTLPNVKSFACSAQVLDLEEEIKKRKIPAKIIHLASCGKDSWMEIKKLHPHLKAKGYSLQNGKKEDVSYLKDSLGVGVSQSHRLAHGLFVLRNGTVIASYIPKQQYGVPNIKRFLNRIEKYGSF
ncbi:hypothetical protein AB3N58_05560 [Leptospira sp. WS60.C2]